MPRINDQILRFFNDLPRAREVRLVGEDGEQQGIVAAVKALEMATEAKRYSDADLAEFKEIIIIKMTSAKSELTNLLEQMQNPNANGGNDTDSSYQTLEDGQSSSEKEQLSQLAARQRKFIENLDNALTRIENKTYGICKVTGKLIAKERLRAVPHTTLSMEAKLQQYK